MKYYIERHEYKRIDDEGKEYTEILFLYPYQANKPKVQSHKFITMLEIEEPENEYSIPSKDENDEFVWEFDKEKWLNDDVRPKRNALLDDIDIRKCNAINWSYMTADEKEKWKLYKEALKDLPETIEYDTQVFPKYDKQEEVIE